MSPAEKVERLVGAGYNQPAGPRRPDIPAACRAQSECGGLLNLWLSPMPGGGGADGGTLGQYQNVSALCRLGTGGPRKVGEE